MNILFLITLSEMGGAQKYVCDLALALANQGHHVSIAAGPDRHNSTGGWRQGWLFRKLSTFRHFDISTYQLPHLERSTGFFREFQTLINIIRIIKLERPDVIHLNSTKIGGLGGLAGRLMRVKTVYTVHGLVLNEPLPSLLWIFYWILEKLAFALCNRIIAISRFDQERIIDLWLAPKEKTSLISLTIDPEALNFLPQEEARRHLATRIMGHGTKEDKNDLATRFPLSTSYMIGTIANFYPTKDLSTLLKAAQIVVKQKPDAKFVIIGDGPGRNVLESQIAEYKLWEKAFLLGSIENASKFLPGLNLFVLSSVKEGLPQVLQEAVAAGIPIASTNVGGIPDLKSQNPDYPWIMIEPKNPKLFADGIIHMLNNATPSPQKTKELLKQEFDSFLQKTETVYESLRELD